MTAQLSDQRRKLQDFLNFHPESAPVHYTTHDETSQDGYQRVSVTYLADEGDPIYAYLLIPEGDGPFPAVLLQHQHHGQRHLGKSEVCGLAGDPLQAFGPVLAQRGFIVLAPDAICFEDRRRGASGIEPHPLDTDWHYDEMCRRLVQGDTLMSKVLRDAALGLSLLEHHPRVLPDRIGTCGHSMGGSTVLFHAALDARIQFACSSGAASSYQSKLADHKGLEMSLVIPGFAAEWDMHHLLQCIAPRPLLVVSAKDAPHSQDAQQILQVAKAAYQSRGATGSLEHQHYAGSHAITQKRFDAIIHWLGGFLP